MQFGQPGESLARRPIPTLQEMPREMPRTTGRKGQDQASVQASDDTNAKAHGAPDKRRGGDHGKPRQPLRATLLATPPESETVLALRDLSDRADGPALVAFWGSEAAQSEFRLGTREYGWHRHLRGQFFCIENGLVHVRTRHGSWILPPHRAGWLPPGIEHKVSISGALSGWGVMLTPAASGGLPPEPRVLGVSELLRALVRRATSWSQAEHLLPEQERVVAVLLDEMRLAPHEPLHLPMPSDRRLLRVATALLAQPADARTLASLAGEAGLSERTLRRLFLAETGMSLQQWRQQARLTLALERLAGGDAVNDVAEALGYATPSNFIAMFRKAFGDSPARYFSRRREPL